MYVVSNDEGFKGAGTIDGNFARACAQESANRRRVNAYVTNEITGKVETFVPAPQSWYIGDGGVFTGPFVTQKAALRYLTGEDKKSYTLPLGVYVLGLTEAPPNAVRPSRKTWRPNAKDDMGQARAAASKLLEELKGLEERQWAHCREVIRKRVAKDIESLSEALSTYGQHIGTVPNAVRSSIRAAEFTAEWAHYLQKPMGAICSYSVRSRES